MTANMVAKSHCNHCIAWEKIICNICIYQPETDTFIGMIMLPTAHHREFSCVQENPHYYPGIFYQFLFSNQYFLDAALKRSLRFPFYDFLSLTPGD